MVLSVILLIVIIGLLLALWKIRKLKQRTAGTDPPMELSTVKNNEAYTSNQQDNYSEAYEDRSANKGYVNLPPKPPKLPKPRKKSEEVQEEFAYSSCP